MNHSSVFPAGTIVNPNAITSDGNGYVYIGTNIGLVVYRGGPVDSARSYIRVTTADGLPTNNINGIAIDTFAKRIILAHSAGISFMKFKTKIEASLEWDYSFPKPDIKPKGVATDGAARLYVKVRGRGKIKRVSLEILNDPYGINKDLRGKLKVANILDKYSNEANEGTSREVNRTDSTPTGDFYFWYVAPNDFAKDSLSVEARLAEREDSIKVKVRYIDDSEDSSYVSVKLQRPPVVLGGGGGFLGGIGRSLQGMLKGVGGLPLLKNDLFAQKIGLMMNPLADIAENISRFLDADLLQNEDKDKSIPGVVDNMRKMGFASNRVDFIAHGIAGNIARAAASVKKAKFYADGDHTYNNYGKGFFNKLISIVVPHNGSPVMDMFNELAGKITANSGLGSLSGLGIGKILQNFPDTIKPYPFLIPIDSTVQVAGNLVGKALMEANRFVLPQTQVKNHIVVSNVDMDPAAPKPYKGGGFLGGIGRFMHALLRDMSPLLKGSLTTSMDSLNSQLFKSLNLANMFAGFKGIADFTKNSDLFSHLSSQAAGQALTLPNITKVTSDSADDVTHEGILNFAKIGRLVENLLNTTISSPLFSDVIPANNTPAPAALQLSQKPVTVFYDTNKVVTDDRQAISNQNLRTTNATTLTVKYRVKDTVGLQYIYINFQDSMYTTTKKARNQQVTLKVRKGMAYSGIQHIEAVGVYETADSIKYHADTLRTYVVPPTIQDFRVKAEEIELYDDILFHPAYEVKVNNVWEDLASSDTAIKIAIEKPTLLAYDAAKIAFHTVNDGYSRAYFTYRTFKDTVSFRCATNSLSAINRSIVSGSFKAASTWSKGRPPLPGDSIIIASGHALVLDTTVQIRSLRIDNGGSLTLNNATQKLQLGDAEDGDFVLDNYGALNISNGSLSVKGRVKLNAAVHF
jgi:hypothetical protein